MSKEEQVKMAVVEPGSAEPQATTTSKTNEPVPGTGDNIAKVREAAATVLAAIATKGESVAAKAKGFVTAVQETIPKAKEAVAAMQSTAVEAKRVVSGAQARAREAARAVATKMQSATAEVMEAASDVQASVAKAKSIVQAESVAAKARLKTIKRSAVAEAKGAWAGAQAHVTELTNSVKTAVQQKATGGTSGKTAMLKKSVAAKSRRRTKAPNAPPPGRYAPAAKVVSNKLRSAKDARTGARKVARKTKR
jgi:hypothetical protein